MARFKYIKEIMGKVTILELYNWAAQNGVLDYEVLVQFRDGGGICDGDEPIDLVEIRHDEKSIVV